MAIRAGRICRISGSWFRFRQSFDSPTDVLKVALRGGPHDEIVEHAGLPHAQPLNMVLSHGLGDPFTTETSNDGNQCVESKVKDLVAEERDDPSRMLLERK